MSVDREGLRKKISRVLEGMDVGEYEQVLSRNQSHLKSMDLDCFFRRALWARPMVHSLSQ